MSLNKFWSHVPYLLTLGSSYPDMKLQRWKASQAGVIRLFLCEGRTNCEGRTHFLAIYAGRLTLCEGRTCVPSLTIACFWAKSQIKYNHSSIFLVNIIWLDAIEYILMQFKKCRPYWKSCHLLSVPHIKNVRPSRKV